MEDDYDQALLLAVEGRHFEDSPETQANLLATVQRSPDAIAVMRSETEAFVDLGLTPDGGTLVASGLGLSPSMSTYDVATRDREASIPGSAAAVSSAVSPDGRHAVMSYSTLKPNGEEHELHIVDIATLRVIARLPGPPDLPLTRLSYSPDGRYIAAVTDSNLSGAGVIPARVFVWDVDKGGRPVIRYRFFAPNFQRDAVFLPDSKRILVAGARGTAIVDIASGRVVGRIDGAHPPIAISKDGRTLAAATDMSPGVVIGLFDPTSGERSGLLAGHRERLVRLAFSPDGTKLASGADDRLVMVWDMASGRRAVYEGHAAGVNALAFSPDGRTLWSGGDDRAIFAWDLQGVDTLVHQPSPALADAPALPFDAQGMVIGPGGRDVAFPSTEQVPFQIRDVVTGAVDRPSAIEDGVFTSFSPDGKRYLTIDEDLRLRVWDRETSALIAVSEGRGFSPFHEGTAVFTPDGREVVALRYDAGGPDNDDLVVLDASTLAPTGGDPVLVGSKGRMVSVTPDGSQAVVVASRTDGTAETNVLIVDLETRRIVRSTPIEPGGQPFAGARNNTVAPDGRTVGIGGAVGDVVVVDAVTGEVSPLLHAHDDFVESVTFAPDYATFVTTGRDGAVKLWDVASQQLLGSVLPLGPNHRVRASFLAADRVLIVYDTGEIFEWDPRPDSWEAYACKVVGRNLTQAEWSDLFPGQAYRVTCPDSPAGG